MKISAVSIAKLSEEKKAIPVIATGRAYEKQADKMTKREKAIRDALAEFNVGTRKTSGELIHKINGNAEFLRVSEAVTDREIINVCKAMQFDKIGIVAKQNRKGEYFYTRLDWQEFITLDIACAPVTLAEQAKEKAERAAKIKAKKEHEIQEAIDARLAAMGISESEILALDARASVKTA